MESEQPELLFFDTFSHDTSEELNLDLVQFTKTVFVTEIRIIPLGARVQADFPGGVRLGATNPSQFKIEFFVNDLSKPGASTFEPIGGIEYNQNGNIHIECPGKITTDGLVLRGWYTTITLAVYGHLTKAIETGSLPPQTDVGTNATAEWVQHHAQPIGSYDESLIAKEAFEGDWDQGTPEDKAPWDRKEKDFHNRAERDFRDISQESGHDVEGSRVPRGPSRRPRSPRTPPAFLSGQDSISIKKEKEDTPSQADFDSLSPESISEGEIPEADGEADVDSKQHLRQPTPPAANLTPPIEDRSIDVEPYEPILSDEEMPDDGDQQFNDMDYEFGDYSEDSLKTFNPYSCEIKPFLHLSPPDKTTVKSPCKEINDTLLQVRELLHTLCSERNVAVANESWVHAAEQLVTLLPSATCSLSHDDVDKLSRTIETGLDLEEALRQPQPGYKLRHIKAGVRLVEVACQFGEPVTKQLLTGVSVHQKLFKLYDEEYMALSIKLMILKSLDATLQCKEAFEYFLNSGDCNGYNQLLKMVDKKPLARVQFAINSLLQKIHLYELLEQLNQSVANLVTEERKVNDESTISDVDVDTISNYLEEIMRIYKHASMLMSHPKRFLPVSAQFEVCQTLSQRYTCSSIFIYFKIHRLLESFLILMTHPSYSCYSSIVIPIYEMISCLQESHDGLKFLMSVPETINPLLKVLLNCQVTSEENEELSLESSSQIGLHLAYRLQALSHIDHLMKLHEDGKTDPDHSEVFEQLHALFCLTLSVVGKMSVVHVLSRDYISIIIKYYKEKASYEESKVKQSPGKSYLADLITMTVKLSDHVPFLQKYAKELLDIISKNSSEDLKNLLPWLKPVENSSAYSYDDISSLVEVIKQNIPDNGTSLSGSLLTSVRVLKYLGISPNGNDITPYRTNLFEYKELKYKFVIIQLFSLEGINLLQTILQKICETYEQPTLHSARLHGEQGLALVSFFHPTLQLIRKVLTYVIKCRNVEFKDMTIIPILLKCYLLMQAIPPSIYTHRLAQKVCRDVVETLLAFTQPIVTDLGSESDALTKSLWTQTVAEILKFTVASPNHFMPGLSLLSELLPLPLQVQTRSPLKEDEVTKIINCRKLWSVHLHCSAGLVQEMITTICATSYNPLLQLLRSVCVQLADLAAATAICVTRAVLDSIVKSMTPRDQPVTGHLMRLLTFLACLATHATIKAAILQLTMKPSTGDKANQCYSDLVVSLCFILQTAHSYPAHIQAQECIVSLVQSLCHCEVTLVPPPGMTAVGSAPTPPEVYLANTLPNRDLLGTLMLVLLEHVNDSRSSLATVQPSLRTFLMLTEHDYGFFHLKICFEKKRGTLWSVLTKIASEWATERADTLSTLNTLLELLRGCLTPDAPDEVIGLPARVSTMSASELAILLIWGSHSEENKHPLYVIETLLQESRAQDETLETMCENVTELIRLLEEEGSKPVEAKEFAEPLLPASDSLLAQFSARPVFVISHVDDGNLTATYWLSVPSPEDHESEINQVPCDLMELALQELPDLQLADSVASLCHQEGVPGDLESEAASPNKRASSLSADTSTQPFIAPMRGRGFRGSTQRGDMFRSRLPNTSRPPSLHVDDFVALETCGQQPTGPTGYNKSSMRAAQDLMATRARGGRPRPFGVDRGGRFFPTPYSRRDNGSGRDWYGEGLSVTGPGFQSSDEMRGLRPSEPPHFSSFSSCRPPLRGAPHAPWLVKDSRDRFSTSITGSSLHQAEPSRNMRFFSR